MPRSHRADQIEGLLRQADSSLEKWLRTAKKRGAGMLRQGADDVQVGLKKLSARLEQVERERTVTPPEQPKREPKAPASKPTRARTGVARKP
ncbi:MAG: hypothetical protein M3Z28_04175, partial [Candidatus Dormibacteraeota bacterium]|nr:hypothetical protein [Candidatus Dormibacteraeota bacterium]